MFDAKTIAQLRGVIREEVRTAVREESVSKHEFTRAITRLDQKIDDLRADMQAQFVAQKKMIVLDVCEFINDHVLPAIPAR